MSGRFLVLLFAVLLAGCRHTHAVDSSDERDQNRVNRAVQDRRVTLVLKDGPSLAVRNARAGADSLFWMNVRTGQMEASSLTYVEELNFRRHARGAVDGAGLGFLIGMPLGALLIDSPSGAGERVSAALAGGVSFGLWGLVIGGVVGSRITYRFSAPEQSERSPP